MISTRNRDLVMRLVAYPEEGLGLGGETRWLAVSRPSRRLVARRLLADVDPPVGAG